VIKLYTWATPNGNKIVIMLEEILLPYELVPVNLGKREQYTPEFLRINANAKIPAIIDPEGPDGRPITLFESGAILIYLAEKTGRFLPAEPRDRHMVNQWIMFQMANTGPMFGQLHHFKASAPDGNDYARERYQKEGERLLGVLDGHLAQSEYLVGNEYSIADICNWPWIRSWIYTLKNDLGGRSHLRRWYDAIEVRPAVRKGVEIYNRLRASTASK
jgi:GSH-dependent disulfide-bond oxidoreductase